MVDEPGEPSTSGPDGAGGPRDAAGGAADETAPLPGGPTGGPGGPADGPARWSARAHLPPPTTHSGQEDSGAVGGADADDESNWLMPVLVAVVALVLLALLGTGIWLILRNLDRGAGTPVPSRSPDVTGSPSASVPPSSAAATPSSVPSTLAPTTPQPALVTIPDLRGLPSATALQRLRELGLVGQVRNVPDDVAAPGTVVGAEPGPGVQVEPSSTVLLLVAQPPQPSPSTTRSPGRTRR